MAFKKTQVHTGARNLILYNCVDWVGVDLDGTLALYEPGDYSKLGAYTFGAPIPKMVELIRALLDSGAPVKIVTARHNSNIYSHHARDHNAKLQEAITAWTFEHIGTALEVTSSKDGWMHALIDDRALSVESNTGNILGNFDRVAQLINEDSLADSSEWIVR